MKVVRALRWLLLLPLAACMGQLFVLSRSRLAWFYTMLFYGFVVLALVAFRLAIPWLRARSLRASGHVLLHAVNVVGVWVCDVGALLVLAGLVWGGSAAENVLLSTWTLPLLGCVVLGVAASVFAAMELGGVRRTRDGQVVTDKGIYVTAMSRAEEHVFVLSVDGRSEWVISRGEWAAFDVLMAWLREEER